MKASGVQRNCFNMWWETTSIEAGELGYHIPNHGPWASPL